MDAIQTDSVIYKILTDAAELLNITGGIYTAGERPDGSDKEDIVINNISFEHTTPKRGITNVNIHVPDLLVVIDGLQQYKTNRERLKQLGDIVAGVIDSAVIKGININIDSSQLFADTNHEHYLNLRCSWLIAKPYTSELDVADNEFIKKLNDLENRVKKLEERQA